jgi:hypothetical protein
MQRRTNNGEGAIHGGNVYEGGGAYNAEVSEAFLYGILHIIYPVADKSCYGMIAQQKYIASKCY